MIPAPTSPPPLPLIKHPIYRWGMLALILALLFVGLQSRWGTKPFDGLELLRREAVPVILLLNHLALSFDFPRKVQRLLVLGAFLGAAVGLVSLFTSR